MSRARAILLFLLAAAVCSAAEFYPFFQSADEGTNGTFLAVRPFYSHAVLPQEELEIREYLWPLYARREFKDEKSWRALILLTGRTFDREMPEGRRHLWVMPFWFSGKSADGESYAALFPLGGTLREFLGRDEAWFVLFPLYAESRVNDLETRSVLWPLISSTHGTGVSRARFWPFYGVSEREDEYRRKFVLWPFWTSAEFYDPRQEGSAWMLFPLISRGQGGPDGSQKSLYLIPPLFRFSSNAVEKVTNCPWPFLQFREGPVNKTYFWPVYGTKESDVYRSRFFLWPFIWSTRSERPEEICRRFMTVPFIYSEKRCYAGAEEPGLSYFRFWPLLSHERDGDDWRFRMFELWPFGRSGPIERNYAPLWAPYVRGSHDGEYRHRVLWGWLYDAQSEGADSEWNLLKGLAGYKVESGRRTAKVLWFIKFRSTGE